MQGGGLGAQCQARVCAYRVDGESIRGFTGEGTFGSSILQSCETILGSFNDKRVQLLRPLF